MKWMKEFKEDLKQYALNREEEYTDELVERFIDKITVYKESFSWKLNLLSDIINMKVLNKRQSNPIEIEANIGELTTAENGRTSCNQSRNE